MEWLKKNGPLAIGIGLPVALILFFALAMWIPKLLVADPKYDILYLTNYNETGTNTLHYTVRDRNVSFSFSGKNYGYNLPKLYRFTPGSGAVKEITISIPEGLQPQENRELSLQKEVIITPIPVPEIEQLNIDTSSIAPDGYGFRSGYGGSPGLAGGIFFSSSYRYNTVISKDGRIIKFPGGEPYYNPFNIKFIGWVVP